MIRTVSGSKNETRQYLDCFPERNRLKKLQTNAVRAIHRVGGGYKYAYKQNPVAKIAPAMPNFLFSKIILIQSKK